MLLLLLTLSSFLLAVFILVGVHEFGHFACAKLFQVKILRFAIGFGWPLIRWFDKSGTEYVIGLLPVGGYVKLLDTREGVVTTQVEKDAFDQRPIYQRAIILLAGPAINLILAFLIYWLIFSLGIMQIKPVIGEVAPRSMAAAVGVQPGDQITSVNYQSTPGWSRISLLLFQHYGDDKPLVLGLQRQQKNMEITVSTRNWQLDKLKPDLLKSLGIKPYYPAYLKNKESQNKQKLLLPSELINKQHYPILQAWKPALNEVVLFVQFNFVLVKKLITGTISLQSIGGPLSIIQGAGLAAEHGCKTFLNFLAFLSISIGLFNLLPIPGLDGGQLLYLIIEKIRGKSFSIALQSLFLRLSFILFCLLMVQVFVNDLLRLL